MSDSFDLDTRREQVRADRHATAYPLVVVGAVGFHYISFNFSSDWIPWWYGLPLAFVAIWALQRRTDRRHGIGGSEHDDVLMIAFAVFLGTSLVASDTWRSVIPSSTRQYPSVWLLPTVVGLGAIAYRQRNRALAVWTLVLTVGLLLGAAFQESSLGWFDSSIPYQMLLPQLAFLSAVVAGLARYRIEIAAADS